MPAAALLFFTLAIILPAYLILEIPWFRFDAAALVLYTALAYTSARLALLAYGNERRLLSLTFWLFVYTWGVLSALLQVGSDTFPWKRQHSNDEQLEAAVLLLIGLLAYDVAMAAARMRERREHRPRAMLFSLRWTFVIGIAVLAMSWLVVAAVGGPSVLLQPRGELSGDLWREAGGSVAGRNVLEALLRSAPYVACLALLFTVRRRWHELQPRDRLLMAAAFVAILPLTFITNYPNALPRGWLGTVVLSLGFLVLPWRRWTMGCIIAALIAAFVFVFPYSDRNRAKSGQAQEQATLTYDSPAWPLITKGDYDVFVQFVNGTVYAKEVGYTYGKNLLGAALFWVPRRWWQDKPLNSGYTIGLHTKNHVVNLSAPLWAEGYLAAGTLGLLLVMAAYGYFSGVLEVRYVRQLKLDLHWGILQLVVPFWAGYQIFFLRGPLMNSVAYSSFAILLMLLLARWQPLLIGTRAVGR